MPTRIKRPSVLRALAITTVLLGFQGYLGYSALEGQFGTKSNARMIVEIGELEARAALLQAEIDAYRHRVGLFNSASLDPDILTERARALLNMAQAEDILVMVDPRTGLPRYSSPAPLTVDQLSPVPLDRPTL